MVCVFCVRGLTFFVISAFVVLFSLTTPLHAQDQASDCSQLSSQAIADGLSSQIAAASETRKNLRILLNGREVLQVPTGALFSIDLLNDEAVKKRLGELNAWLSQDPLPAVPDDGVVECARSVESLTETISELKQIQQEILRLRYSFLSLAPDKRNELLEIQKAGVAQREQQQQLASEIDTAKQESKEAARSIQKAEEEARQASGQAQKELASQRAILEKVRQDIAQAQIAHSTELKNQAAFYRITSENLSALAGKLATEEEEMLAAEARKNYVEANDHWRVLVDKTFSEIGVQTDGAAALPELPRPPEKLLLELKDQPVADEYMKAYEAVSALRAEVQKKRAERIEDFRNNHYKVLLQSSRLRSKYLQLTLDAGDTSVLQLSDDYFLDLWREIRVVPYRALAIFYTVLVDIRERITGGVAGILSLLRDGVLLVLFIAIPVSFFLGLKRLTARIDRFRDRLVRSGEPDSWRSTLALWIRKINPYLPWILMLTGFWIAKALLANSELENIRDVFSYVEYYIWYRIFKLFVAITLSRAAYSSSLRALSNLRPRIEKTTNIVSIFFFAAFVLLRITEGTVGVALVYRVVSKTTIYIGWGVLAWCAWTWRDQISAAVARTFSSGTADKLQRWCNDRRIGFLVCLPVVCLLSLIAIGRRFNRWVSKFDFYKKISVEILKRKLDVDEQSEDLEDGAKNRHSVARSRYLEAFTLSVPDDPALIIQPGHGLDKRVTEIIRSWAEDDSDEISLAVYGEKGVGKSTLLSTLQAKFADVDVRNIVVPAKLFTADKVTEFIRGHTAEINSRRKTLFVVDDAHNLFLSELGGFEGYKKFLELINERKTNIFWCVAYNKRPWKFLDYVLGRNQFYRNVVELKPFSDVDIQNMIMTRHRQSGYQLEFDEMITAASRSDVLSGAVHAETQFFTLLWGLAKGNPRTALVLWKNAISLTGAKSVLVGIPKPLALRELNGLNEGNFFVYGAILTHENLSIAEAVRTTNLPEGVVRNALKLGEDIEALQRSPDGRYRVNPLAQARLIDFLLGKNIVYE